MVNTLPQAIKDSKGTKKEIQHKKEKNPAQKKEKTPAQKKREKSSTQDSTSIL